MPTVLQMVKRWVPYNYALPETCSTCFFTLNYVLDAFEYDKKISDSMNERIFHGYLRTSLRHRSADFLQEEVFGGPRNKARQRIKSGHFSPMRTLTSKVCSRLGARDREVDDIEGIIKQFRIYHHREIVLGLLMDKGLKDIALEIGISLSRAVQIKQEIASYLKEKEDARRTLSLERPSLA